MLLLLVQTTIFVLMCTGILKKKNDFEELALKEFTQGSNRLCTHAPLNSNHQK